MDLTTGFESKFDLRIHSISGEIVIEELRAALTKLYESPDFRSEQNSLWDLRHANFSGLSAEDVGGISDLVRGNWGTTGSSKSVLVVSEELAFGMSRMYEIKLDVNSQVRVFRNLQEATDWLTGEDS